MLVVRLLLLLALVAVVLGKTVSDSDDDSIDVHRFNSRAGLSSHVKKLNEEHKDSASWDAMPEEKELIELRKEELRLRLQEDDIVARHGKSSKQYTEYLHKLGRSMYKQHKFVDVFTISQEIVRLHEELDGFESENTARALGNLGSAAFRLKKSKDCENAMNRALFIWLQKYGPESKEVLMHRGKMLTFQVPFAKTSGGLSYDDYLYNEL